MKQVNDRLRQPAGVGDGSADTVIVNGTNGNDVISVADDNGVITVSGLGRRRDDHRLRGRR